MPAPYHYGLDLLVGLLTPPVGPDLAFVTEFLGAYIWMSFALLVIATLIQRGSWLVALPLAPLLLTAGAWTLLHVPPWDILQVPVPAGLPSAGLRASLADIYWPAAELPWAWEFEALPNLFRPPYVLAYALAFVVLERAARAGRRSWLSTPDTRGAGRLCRPYFNHTPAGCTCTLDRAGGCGVLDLQTPAQSPCGGDSRRRAGARCLAARCRQWRVHARPDRRGGIWPHIRLD